MALKDLFERYSGWEERQKKKKNESEALKMSVPKSFVIRRGQWLVYEDPYSVSPVLPVSPIGQSELFFPPFHYPYETAFRRAAVSLILLFTTTDSFRAL
jgi:hypothetical protein